LERDVGRGTPGEQELILKGLADAYLRIGEADAAGRVIGQLVGGRPRVGGPPSSKFRGGPAVGEGAGTGRPVGEIRALEDDRRTPEDTGASFWRCARARYLLATARRRGRGTLRPEELDEARVCLAEAGRRRPSWPLVPLSLAEVEDFAGEPGR